MLSYEEFVKRLKEIREKHWVKTHRPGPTGIGKTLEDLLGIKENNIAGPDHERFELKSARKNSHSMLTLFTKSPLPRGANSILRERFGYYPEGESGSKELHTTVSAVDFNMLRGHRGFKIDVREEENRLVLISEDQSELGYWNRETLRAAFEKKYPGLMYVKADSRGLENDEEFCFNEAYLLDGFDFENFIDLVEQGIIWGDIRLGKYRSGPKRGRPHDHGTAFRVKQDKLDLCFEKRERII